ncbi:hypothetical protein HF086_013760 [Spodoptera exigua]|uniref:Ig-like domain-containing protein n=1 Tax=Spodoptera exigua TaxID=7107 RepID=A0A922SDM0_SPOEX|nr:hypothetical protein HF086_013760 [Spodoptera exigua]
MLRRIYPLVVLLVFADVVIKASCTEKGSLTFVIDDTLSMDDDIYYVKRSMDWIMDTVFKNNSTMISNMVLVTFNNSDARVRVVAQNQCDFDKALKEVSANSKDYPEVLSMTGLILALKESNYGSYIYVFTDASAKDHDNVHIVKQLCQEKQSQVDKIVKKTPGKYTLSVFSEKKTSLMLVGRSEFIFKHGFSELKPQSINDTFLQPIAKLPDNQALTVMIVQGKEMSVEYNSSLKLTCKVTAFPIPKISWLNKQGQHLASNVSDNYTC